MKKIFSFSLIVLTAACLLWLTLYRNKSAPKPSQPPAVERPPETTEEQTNGTSPSSNAKPPTAVTNEFVRPMDIDQEHWDRLMQLRQQLLAQNQPIEFYLRLIDQYGNVVSGATLTAKLSRVDEAMFKTTNFFRQTLGDEVLHEPLELVSDAQGWIRFAGRTGRYVFLTAIHKEGYVSDTSQNIGTLIYEPNGKRRTTVSLEMAAAFDPAKGYTFHLWKKGETERLVRWQSGFGLLRPTTNVLINLVSGRVVTTAGDADLEAQVEYLFPDDPDKAADRRIHLRGLHGLTLVETGEPYPYLAAEKGYTPAVHYDTLPSQGYGPGGTWNWQKNFYVLARSGRIRGAIRLDFNSGEMNFGISGYVNPTGSRNLEPDPDKQIADPEEIRRLDEQTRR